jgi:hypothetical protein
MTISDSVTLSAVLLSVGANLALYVRLSSVMNRRFDGVDRKFESVERRLETIQSSARNMDVRLTKLELK